MPDPLHEAIGRALREKRLDGALFERCAAELLRAWYPNLRPVPPMRDAGADGVFGPDADPDFLLVATTAKDYARNLRKSVERYVEAGGPCRAFVLATTREVTGERRLRLADELRKRWGVQLRAVHDRGDFERLLYRSPRWRKDLLGVTGELPALSRFPVRTRPAFPIRTIGRGGDLERLRAAEGDLVLTGRPGVGKTFLLERLAEEGWCLFDAGRDPGELADAVREMRPPRVAIDDAHLAADRLARIAHLREETASDFGIVAVSWPGGEDGVAANLPDAKIITVEELERDRIVEAIEAAGVTGPPDLQRLIADQARGSVGLAVALARACMVGGAGEVVSGEALLNDLAAWYGRTLGKESLQALGVLALAGDEGATLKQVRKILGMGEAKAGNLIRGLAAGGTVGYARPPRICVQPEALRYALVRDVFFGGPGSLDAFSAAGLLDGPPNAALPLIGAAHRGAPVGRDRLQELVDWNDAQAAGAYARLGPDELRTALGRAPAERRTAVAATAYAAGDAPDRALRVLMEQAEAGDRDALGIVGDRLADPGMAAGPKPDEWMEPKLRAAEVAEAWIREGRDVHVGLRVLVRAAHPGGGGSYLDPGLGENVTMAWFVATPAMAKKLGRIWDSILGIAERDPEDDASAAIVLDGIVPWAYPRTLSGRDGPDEKAAEALRRVAADVIGRLAGIFRERLGVLYRLRWYAEHGDLPVRIDAPDWFASLFPGWNSEEYRRGEPFVRRAEELAARPAPEVADLLMRIDREAGFVESRNEMLPRGARRLAREIAARDGRPEGMLAELERRGADGELLGWFLDRAAELRRPGWEGEAERLLDGDGTAACAIRTALVRPAGERLKRLAIGRAEPWTGLVRHLALRGEIDDATLALLFEETDSPVARMAALGLGVDDDLSSGEGRPRLAGLPPPVLARWREIVAGFPPEGYGAPGDTNLAMILERDHALCARWLRAQFARLRERGAEEFKFVGVDPLLDAIANLPPEVRTDLVGDIPAGVLPPVMQDVVLSLTSGNPAAAAALFARPDLEDLHAFALQQPRGADDGWTVDEDWMELALSAMDRGWGPKRIAEAVWLYGLQTWSGPESEHWQKQAEAFGRLVPAPGQPGAARRKRIAEAGAALCGALRDRAARSERDERVYGRGR